MMRLRRILTVITLVFALGTVGILGGPVSGASAKSAAVSGVVSQSLRQYSTWRVKTPGGGVSFKGTVSKAYCCFGSLGWTNGTWAIGLRNRSGTQFTRLRFKPYNGSGIFPYTSGVTTRMEFALNTKGTGMPASDAYANFSGTLNY